nr:unnamed protein product [Saccharomyces cerevisiae]CAA85230.1 unnamed protein product [Saccharomyces cerevisiae]
MCSRFSSTSLKCLLCSQNRHCSSGISTLLRTFSCITLSAISSSVNCSGSSFLGSSFSLFSSFSCKESLLRSGVFPSWLFCMFSSILALAISNSFFFFSSNACFSLLFNSFLVTGFSFSADLLVLAAAADTLESNVSNDIGGNCATRLFKL